MRLARPAISTPSDRGRSRGRSGWGDAVSRRLADERMGIITVLISPETCDRFCRHGDTVSFAVIWVNRWRINRKLFFFLQFIQTFLFHAICKRCNLRIGMKLQANVSKTFYIYFLRYKFFGFEILSSFMAWYQDSLCPSGCREAHLHYPTDNPLLLHRPALSDLSTSYPSDCWEMRWSGPARTCRGEGQERSAYSDI